MFLFSTAKHSSSNPTSLPPACPASCDLPDSIDLQQARPHDNEVGDFLAAGLATPGTGVGEVRTHAVGDA